MMTTETSNDIYELSLCIQTCVDGEADGTVTREQAEKKALSFCQIFITKTNTREWFRNIKKRTSGD